MIGTRSSPALYQDKSAVQKILEAHKRGEPKGVYSICSANQYVLEAAILKAKSDNSILLIETTCNQVNQYGGYSDQTPSQFIMNLNNLADRHQFDREKLIMGGDHLGPHVWQNEPAESAMQKARQLIHDCVIAGYQKIHLDASMKLGDDPAHLPISPEISAVRAADLCQVSEKTFLSLPSGSPKPCYVIGTEVPLPGGTTYPEEAFRITRVKDVAETIEITKKAFLSIGLADAWERVVAVVVQPGVEYGNETLYEYNPTDARPLVTFIENDERLVYEAHSTDYQTRESLHQMVIDHFAVLKVGPALTFAFREAILALELIEKELTSIKSLIKPSNVIETLDGSMRANQGYWQDYYLGDDRKKEFARKYSFSDRCRYYWKVPVVEQAVEQLFKNLTEQKIPLTLLSQFMPGQYARVRSGKLGYSPREWVYDRITNVLEDYIYACGGQ